MKRRVVSVLMALVMALSLLPVQALAEDAAVGEPVTEIEQAEQIGEGEEPGDPEEQIGEGEEPGDPEEGQEPGEPEEPVREFVQGEAQLTVSTAAMAAGTAGERTVPGDIYEALSVGGSLKLLNDVEYSGSMDVAFDLVIDLNGYVLKMSGIKVEKGVHLTIKDSRPDAEHKFTPNTDGLWVLDETNGTKTVKGGVIYGGTGSSIGTSVYGGGVYVEAGGTFTMEGGNIVGCTASATFQARGAAVCSWLIEARSPCPAAVLRAARRWEVILMAAVYTMKEPSICPARRRSGTVMQKTAMAMLHLAAAFLTTAKLFRSAAM